MRRQASSWPRYWLEQLVCAAVGWMPTLIGIGVRAVVYRLILRMRGIAAIEAGVRLRYADHITLGRRAYLDQDVYLHACPQGIDIGDNTLIMHDAILHVYNPRDGLQPPSSASGRDSLIGERNILRGRAASPSATESTPRRWQSVGREPCVFRPRAFYGTGDHRGGHRGGG